MSLPVKITSDLELVIAESGARLTGQQALELGKRLIEKGAEAIALDIVKYPPHGRLKEDARRARREAANA